MSTDLILDLVRHGPVIALLSPAVVPVVDGLKTIPVTDRPASGPLGLALLVLPRRHPVEPGEGGAEVRQVRVAHAARHRAGLGTAGEQIASDAHAGGVPPAGEGHPGLLTEGPMDLGGQVLGGRSTAGADRAQELRRGGMRAPVGRHRRGAGALGGELLAEQIQDVRGVVAVRAQQ
jgi:hypothetical protein